MCELHRRRLIGNLGLGAAALGLGAIGAAQAQPAAQPAAPPGAKWACPPCGCPSDGEVFDKPGACPSCGMTLIPKAAPASATAPAPGPAPAAKKEDPPPAPAPKAPPQAK